MINQKVPIEFIVRLALLDLLDELCSDCSPKSAPIRFCSLDKIVKSHTVLTMLIQIKVCESLLKSEPPA